MRFAIIHDWLTGMRGGERVLEILCDLLPAADVYTLFYFPENISDKIKKNRTIISSNLQHLPFIHRHYRKLLPLFSSAIESFDLDDYDVIISSSHAVAKGAIPGKNSLSICYCHTPMRYIWDRFRHYIEGMTATGSKIAAPYSELLYQSMAFLRTWDKSTSDRVHYFIANSHFIAGEIRSIYDRESVVIHPPVDTSRFKPGTGQPDDYYLIVSADAPYKRLDIAIDAFKKMNKRLIIAGRLRNKMLQKKMSGSRIEPIENPDDDALVQLYQQCKAFIFPGIEDFGLTPLEAQACGRPVIAYRAGGVTESVIEGISGHFFSEQTPSSLIQAVEEFERMDFDRDVIRSRAMEYDSEIFRRRLETYFREIFSSYGIIWS